MVRGLLRDRRKQVCVILLVIAVYIMKNIFIGADNDEAYGIVQGYRLAMGDRLLLEMWEPHQTSAIFTALLIKPFLWLRKGNLDWLTIYLRVVYFIVQFLVSFSLFRTMRQILRDGKKDMAVWMALIFFVSSPKCIYVPEYSNLHIWFATMLGVSLACFLCSEMRGYGKKRMLVLAGIFLSCDVLAYPSMVMLLPVCLFFVYKYTTVNKLKAMCAFLAPCIVGATCLLTYIGTYMSFEQMLLVVPYILGDASHDHSVVIKLQDFVGSAWQILAVLFFCGAIASVMLKIWTRIRGDKGAGVKDTFWVLMLLVLLVHQFYCWFTSEFNASYPHIFYLYICLVGIVYWYRYSREDVCGMIFVCISFVGYFGVMLLSNWEPIHLLPYLIIGVPGGLYYWGVTAKDWCGKSACVRSVLGTLLVISNVFGYCYLIIGGAEVHSTIFSVGSYCREGFRKGILAEYMTAYCYNMNQEDWSEAVSEGESVLYIGPNPSFYLQGKCEIATNSTISTPTYDENLLYYWEINPDKYPDLVVFESMWGAINVVPQDSFIMQWVQNSYGAIEKREYPYLTVYRRE